MSSAPPLGILPIDDYASMPMPVVSCIGTGDLVGEVRALQPDVVTRLVFRPQATAVQTSSTTRCRLCASRAGS